VLVGGGLGNAVLFSIGAALRAAGSRVLYFAGYKKLQDRYKVAEIEAAADEVVWCCDEAPGFPARPATRLPRQHRGAMAAHASGAWQTPCACRTPTASIAIGSDGMMAAVARARHGILAPYLKAAHLGIGSINSPMQCMMKEICAQCLQPQRRSRDRQDALRVLVLQPGPAAGRGRLPGLRARLGQNSLQEKLTAQWIDRALVNAGRAAGRAAA
jgi:hypothetical protein